MQYAGLMVVFSAEVFQTTFARLHHRKVETLVLYPACSIISDRKLSQIQQNLAEYLPPGLSFMTHQPTFLSINRYERKKVS